MTPTTRRAAARRRKRQVINETVIDRALHDPRRARAKAPAHRSAERSRATSTGR